MSGDDDAAPELSLPALTAELVRVYVARRHLQTQEDALKARALAAMGAVGAAKLHAGGTGAGLGTVSLVDPDPAPVVTDPAAFVKWLAQRYPTEVMTVEVTEPRAAFVAKLLAAVDPDAELPIDTGSGEVIPGVEFKKSTAYLRVDPSRQARAAAA